MGDTSGSDPEENEVSLYKFIRSKPVTPGMVMRVSAGTRGRKMELVASSTDPSSTECLQLCAQTKTEATNQGESHGLKILGCTVPGIEERPLSAVVRLGPIKEESVNDFHTTTDEHGDIMEYSDSFQKLKIARNQHGPSNGGDGPMSRYSEDPIINPPTGITIQSLASNAVVVVPETHRSNQESRGRPASSDNEVPVYPIPSQKCKLSRRRRKRRPLIDERPSSQGFHPSVPDEGHAGLRFVNGRYEEDSDGGVTVYSSVPSTARSTMFEEFEMMRPETASSEIVADGMLVFEEEEQLKTLKKMFGIKDDEDWYKFADDTGDNSVKCRIRRLTKLFYRRFEKQSADGLRYTHKLMLSGLHNRLEDFVLLSVPPGFSLKMRITRMRKGVTGKFFPLYYMHLERDTPGDRKCLIMVAKKHRVFGGTGYTLSTDPAELTVQSEYCVGKIDSNFIGTEFTLYSGRSICSHVPLDKGALMALPKVDRFKEELASVLYDPNVLGFKGPRKMKVVMPKMKNLLEREAVRPRFSEESLLQRYQAEENPPLWCLKNKDPIWNRDTHSYILNFAGRVHAASVKNFQIVCEDNEEHILLQFGRASENTFSLDFQYPFSPLQAFAVALTSFDSKLACE